MVKQAARDFVEEDKKGINEWKKSKIEILKEKKANGEISEEQFNEEIEKIDSIIKGQQLTKVTVGIGYTDVNLNGLEYDKENRFPEEEVEYIKDSRTQLILYEDKEIEHEENDLKTEAMYRDSKSAKKLVSIDTSEIEASRDDDDDEYDDDEYDDDEYDDDEYDEDEYDEDEYDEDEYDEDEYDEDEYDEDEYDEDEYYDDEYEQEEHEEDVPDEDSRINFLDEIYVKEEEEYDEITGTYDIDGKNSKIKLEDIRRTINYVTQRSEARRALRNIERYLKNEKDK